MTTCSPIEVPNAAKGRKILRMIRLTTFPTVRTLSTSQGMLPAR